MNSVFLAWQDPHEKSWHFVGKLTYEEDQRLYRFAYTRGTQNSVHFMRVTDLLRVFALPELATPEGLYEVYFFHWTHFLANGYESFMIIISHWR